MCFHVLEGLYKRFTASLGPIAFFGNTYLIWVLRGVARLCAHMGQLSGYWQLGASVKNGCVQVARRSLHI